MQASGVQPASPTPTTEGRARVGSLDIGYDVRGTGEPILLIPGVTMRRIFWPDALADELAAQGFRVVRMDPRDVGDSSRIKARPPHIPRLLGRTLLGLRVEVPYRLEDMADDALGLMRELGHERFHVAGASMGGMIAQTIAITHPARLLSLASVMSGPGGRRYSVGKLSAMRALLRPMPADRDGQITRMIETFRILHGTELPFDEAAALALALAQVEAGASQAGAARQLGAIFESGIRRRPRLASIKTPTLVVHGLCDPLLPLRGARATARLIRGAELLLVPKMGHYFPAACNSQIARAIGAHARKAA